MSIRIVYIVGCTHSGTTLLNRVLGTHTRMINVGGIKNLPLALSGRKRCSCQAPSLTECPFWKRVDSSLREVAGRGLHDLDCNADDPDTFRDDNVALCNAIRAVSGADIIVDSSRHVRRLEKLDGVADFDVLPVHLFKCPRGQAASWRRKGWGMWKILREYSRINANAMATAARYRRSVTLEYESFCRRPDSEVRRITDALDIEYEPAMCHQWGDTPMHVLGGNHMKLSTDSTIRLDRNWQRLSLWAQGCAELAGRKTWRKMIQQAGMGSERTRQ